MRRSSACRATLVLALWLPALASWVHAQDPPKTPSLSAILERAGEYVTRHEEAFRNLVAEESYRQGEVPFGGQFATRNVRNLRSEIVFVRMSGPLPWRTFRDILDVDGKEVRDHGGRLERLFASPSATSFEQARAIVKESSRYNLHQADAPRTVNAPTLGLLFLLPDNQKRLSFKRKGGRTIAGFATVEVAGEERTSPTLVADRWNHDVPESGRFWIDPTRGAVLLTEIRYDLGKAERSADSELTENGVVATEYRREPGLDIFVPDTMTERYRLRGVGIIEGVARYSHYRRFQVTSTWEIVDPTKPSRLPAESQGSTPDRP
jgi:hypothetical protein